MPTACSAMQQGTTTQHGRAHPGWVVLQWRSLPPGCSHVWRHHVLALTMRCQHLVHLADKSADAGGMDVPALHVHTAMYTLHPAGQTDCRVLRLRVSLQLHLCCFDDSSCCVPAPHRACNPLKTCGWAAVEGRVGGCDWVKTQTPASVHPCRWEVNVIMCSSADSFHAVCMKEV